VKGRRALALAALAAGALLGADAEDEPLAGFERTPPRLAWARGEASFLRPGAEDWAPARANLPLAPGDRLYTGEDGALEIQLGPRDFLRAGERTELGLESHDPDFLQVRIGAGLVSLDLRSLPDGNAVELGTPSAAFTIETDGYYRVEVGDDATTFTARRGGRATLARPDGPPLVVGASEQVVVGGEDGARAESYAAPELDDWDRWNFRRTDGQLDALSTRWAGDVYGASDLDEHGSWRTIAPYGPIWIPRVHASWAPYAVGRWLWDPHFGWTWLDDAPWGWAPFHYGRWLFLQGRWAWAPGPLGPRLFYAPALVAFYGSHRTTVLWVPLGWGEPCRPWWGPRRWIGRPHWLGWSGPRIAAETHANAKLRGGAIAVPGATFGRSPVERARTFGPAPGELRLVRGALPVERAPLSYVGGDERAPAPPAPVLERRVVSTRPPRTKLGVPEPRLAPAPELRGREPWRGFEPLPRPPFGAGDERRAPKAPPRYEPLKPQKLPKLGKEPKRPKSPKPGEIGLPGGEAPGESLPGEPANRVYRPTPTRVPAPGGGVRGPQRVR
jgi:hypothetical protein